ncbi:hypothetical protein NDU88_003212 [Pleurodeles waltl]|uniref:Reverse transcriptase n=1 Tax=Pleurodeles waltl TaxID=8319 RepID=A0AAV7LEP2_PLEWA|nr:hypothetical protein NDU88_003212 [Pleurodeles waltl]
MRGGPGVWAIKGGSGHGGIVANRLVTVIIDLVREDQHGVVPGWDTTGHVNSVITALEAGSAKVSPLGAIMLDAEQAFDRVASQTNHARSFASYIVTSRRGLLLCHHACLIDLGWTLVDDPGSQSCALVA